MNMTTLTQKIEELHESQTILLLEFRQLRKFIVRDLSVSQFAKAARIHPRTVYRLIQAQAWMTGKIPYFTLDGTRWICKVDDYLQWERMRA